MSEQPWTKEQLDTVVRLCGELNGSKVRQRLFTGFATAEEGMAYILPRCDVPPETVGVILEWLDSCDPVISCPPGAWDDDE